MKLNLSSTCMGCGGPLMVRGTEVMESTWGWKLAWVEFWKQLVFWETELGCREAQR